MKVFFASLVALFVGAIPAFAGHYAAPVRVVRVVRPVVVVRQPVFRQPVVVVRQPVVRSAGCCHWQRVVLSCGTVKFVRVCR